MSELFINIHNWGIILGIFGFIVAALMLVRDVIKNYERRSSLISIAIIIAMIAIAASEITF